MASPEEAAATQLRNIIARTGHDVSAWRARAAGAGLSRHGEIRDWLKAGAGLGHGDANALAHHILKADAHDEGDPLDSIYAGAKAHLRPIHDALLDAIAPWGDFEVAPKKANVSLRRKKQFALLGPKNNSVAVLGINLKSDAEHPLLVREKPGGMCQYSALLSTPADLDPALLEIVRAAWEAAG